MSNKTEKLEVNNHKIRKKILKVTPSQPKHLYIPQSIHQRESTSSHSLSIINQINFKNWYINIQDTFELKPITLLNNGAY